MIVYWRVRLKNQNIRMNCDKKMPINKPICSPNPAT